MIPFRVSHLRAAAPRGVTSNTMHFAQVRSGMSGGRLFLRALVVSISMGRSPKRTQAADELAVGVPFLCKPQLPAVRYAGDIFTLGKASANKGEFGRLAHLDSIVALRKCHDGAALCIGEHGGEFIEPHQASPAVNCRSP